MTLAPAPPSVPATDLPPIPEESVHEPCLTLERPPHVKISGVPILDGDQASALTFCRDALRLGCGARIATANLDFLALAMKDPALHANLAACDLVVADGAPVAWLARVAGARHVARVAGVDLVSGLLGLGTMQRPLRVAVYGSSETISERAAARIASDFPNVSIACRICPPFRALEADEIEAECSVLHDAAPDLVLVALGCPRQEQLIASYFDSAPKALWIGIGGTLDFLAGHRKRAPGLAQRAGLEWTIRLAQEPRRLWRRYLLRDIPALVRLVPASLAGRHRSAPAALSAPPKTAGGHNLNPLSTLRKQTDANPAPERNTRRGK